MHRLKLLITTALLSAASTAGAARPAEIFAIGDFNDWALPEGEEYNGALPMNLSEGTEDYYWEDLKVPRGSEALMFYYHDEEADADVFLGSPLPAFTLYKFAGSVKGTCTEAPAREEVEPFRLRDWRGTRIMGGIYLDSRSFSMAAFDGPAFVAPASADAMYAVVTVDDAAPLLIHLDEQQLNPYFWELDFTAENAAITSLIEGAESVEVVFTSEESASPSAASCWGCPASSGASESGVMEFFKGGSPFRFNFAGSEPPLLLSISANFTTGLATVECSAPGYTDSVAQLPTEEAGEPAQYYDLRGARLATPPSGEPYIRVEGGKSSKILHFQR